MRKTYAIFMIGLSILTFSCKKKGKTTKNITAMANEERLTFFKTMTTSKFFEYIKTLRKEDREKVGFELAKEGKRFFEQSNYKKAYEYFSFGNVLLPFKAEYNYLMARTCSRLNRTKQALMYLQKASSVDKIYARKSTEEEDFKQLRDSEHWRKIAYEINDKTLAGKWRGHKMGIILKLFPNRAYKYYVVKNSVIDKEKDGSWLYQKVKLPDGKFQHRVILRGGVNGTYVVQVQKIEGFTMHEIGKFYRKDTFFPAFKKKNYSGRKKLFN